MSRAPQMGFAGQYRGVKDPRTGRVVDAPGRGYSGWRSYGSVTDPITGQIGPGVPLESPDRETVSDAMQNVLNQLRNGLAIAQAKAADAAPGTLTQIAAFMTSASSPILNWVSDAVGAQSEVSNNVSNGLKLMSRQVDMRDAETSDVLAGRLDASRWYVAAKATADGIESILATLGDYTTGAIIHSAVADAKKDFTLAVKEFVEQVESVAKVGGTILAVAVVGAAILLWPVVKQILMSYIPQRKLSGFPRLPSGSRRRRRSSRRRR